MAASISADNNVGIAEVGSVVDLPQETWERVFKVNLTSAFLAMKHVIPVMQRQFAESGTGGLDHQHLVDRLDPPYRRALCQLFRHQGGPEPTTDADHRRAIRCRKDPRECDPGLMKTPMVEHSAGLAQVYGEGDVAAMWAARDAQVPMGHMGEAWDVAHAAPSFLPVTKRAM